MNFFSTLIITITVSIVSVALIACGNNSPKQSSEPNTPSYPAEEGVQVGGSTMLPSASIIENARNAKNLSTLVTAIQRAGLMGGLEEPGPFTVFAPTNNAFSQLPAGKLDMLLEKDNRAELRKVLLYHVVAGSYTLSDLKNGMKLDTLQGGFVTIRKKGREIFVNNARIEIADVVDSNGVSFIIDTALDPNMKKHLKPKKVIR